MAWNTLTKQQSFDTSSKLSNYVKLIIQSNVLPGIEGISIWSYSHPVYVYQPIHLCLVMVLQPIGKDPSHILWYFSIKNIPNGNSI